MGVYIFENFVINFSVGAFLFDAFSTNSNILATVDSPYSLVTLTFKTPLLFISPDKISSPALISRGTDSPVNAEVSKKLSPLKTTPSNGTLSPGFINITSFKLTSSGDTLTSLLLLKTFA